MFRVEFSYEEGPNMSILLFYLLQTHIFTTLKDENGSKPSI